MVAFLAIIYLGFLVIRPYLVSIFMSIVVAYLLYPIYEWFGRRLRKSISAVIMILLVISVIVLPLLVIINSVSKETETILKTFNAEDFLKGVEDVMKLVPSKPLYTYIDEVIDMASLYVLEKAKSFLIELPPKDAVSIPGEINVSSSNDVISAIILFKI